MRFAWEQGGLAGVQARFDAPPRSTQTILASEHQALQSSKPPSTPPAPTAPAPWSLVTEDVLGAWLLFLALADETGDTAEARQLALGWRGDGAWTYADDGAAATTIVWRIDLATETAAERVAEILAGEQQGTRVVVARTNDGSPPAWALEP
jgi:hypothetical protein